MTDNTPITQPFQVGQRVKAASGALGTIASWEADVGRLTVLWDGEEVPEIALADALADATPEADVSQDLADLTGPQLVTIYNEHVVSWLARGGDNRFGIVRRFAKAEVGRERVARIRLALQELPEAAPVQSESSEQSEDDMAKKREAGRKPARKSAGARKAPAKRTTSGPSLRDMLEEYNGLVPKAKKAGVTWAHIHKSNFESKEKAVKQLARLKDAIRKAS